MGDPTNDRIAQQAGFRDAQTMLAFLKRREEMQNPAYPQAQPSGLWNKLFGSARDLTDPNSQVFKDSFAIHPAELFRNIGERIQAATGQKPK